MKWCKAVNREDLMALTDRQRHKFRVCDVHFTEDSKFAVCRNRTNLKHNAVPTLLLGLSETGKYYY